MSFHRTRRRALIAALVALTAALAAGPSGALGAPADGPYTPFPEAPGDPPDDLARSYVDQLIRRGSADGRALTVTPQQLAEGVTLPGGPNGGRGASVAGGGGGEGGQATGSGDQAGRSSAPFERAGFAQASPPPDPSVAGFLIVGGLVGLAALAVGVYRVRRPWAA